MVVGLTLDHPSGPTSISPFIRHPAECRLGDNEDTSKDDYEDHLPSLRRRAFAPISVKVWSKNPLIPT